MTTLLALQRQIADDLMGLTPGLIEGLVVDAPRADRATLVGVYRHAYRARLIEVLEIDFPATRTLMGAETFAAAAAGYIGVHPSRHPSVRWLGRHLPAYLAATGQDAAAEMAAFEWSLGLAFDAAPAGTVDIADLAALGPEAWEGLKVDFQPGLSLLTLRHGVAETWPALRDGDATNAPSVLAAPLPYAIWRQGLEPQYRPLQPGEDGLLQAMAAGAAFAEALGETDPQQALQWFAGWCISEMISALRL